MCTLFFGGGGGGGLRKCMVCTLMKMLTFMDGAPKCSKCPLAMLKGVGEENVLGAEQLRQGR